MHIRTQAEPTTGPDLFSSPEGLVRRGQVKAFFVHFLHVADVHVNGGNSDPGAKILQGHKAAVIIVFQDTRFSLLCIL